MHSVAVEFLIARVRLSYTFILDLPK
jgi:hypothetical protein